jgi:N-acetylglucosamine kinase-like BadF-type ATPase
MNTESDRIFVGVDVGGTKSVFAFMKGDVSETLYRRSEGANLSSRGSGKVAKIIGAGLELIPGVSDQTCELTVCAGVAGAGQASGRERLREILTRDFPCSTFIIRTDADIALDAALGNESGMVIIAGTGSGVHIRDENGNLYRAGGWGSVIGDQGSGVQLGKRALAAVVNDIDGGPGTRIRSSLETHFELSDQAALVEWIRQPDRDLAALAPLVLEAAGEHDDIAELIVYREVRALAKQATWALSRVASPVRPHVVLIGGLFGNSYFTDAVRLALLEHVPGFKIGPAQMEPADAALHIALATR